MTQPGLGGPAMGGPMVIAIDGPAGAGKSTVARRLAERLGILRLDTGAMYRAATVGVLAAGIDRDDAAGVAAWVAQRTIDFSVAGRVRLDGRELPEADIRSPATTREIWRVSDHPACRAHLVAQQQAIVRGRDVVIEGRDAGTVIAPEAQLKVFLDASVEERARRRVAEWQGAAPSPADVIADISERDRKDRTRSVGALAQADDALALPTDGLSIDEVVARIAALAVQRRPFFLERAVADLVVVGRSRQPGYVDVAQGTRGAWQLGLTNPTPERMPGGVRDLTRNHGGRQAGTLLQGAAVLVLAGKGDAPGAITALPMLPQTWYVIEPGAWHAVVQQHGTVCAWAESSAIREERAALGDGSIAELAQWLRVLLPADF